MITDTHAHYTDTQFSGELGSVLEEVHKNGVDKIITCAVDFNNAENVLKLCDKYDFLYAAVGIYPHNTHTCPYDEETLRKLAGHKKVVAIGEIGLDYFYDDAPKATQLEAAEGQIILANELNLPISFHDREAHNDSLNLLKKYKPKGVVHCFSGSVEMAKEIVKLGMYLGIGGALTFKNARVLPEVIKEIPIENLVLETDAPYMAPVPVRGKRNRSDYIKYIAEKIAEIKGIYTNTVFEVTNKNSQEIFNF